MIDKTKLIGDAGKINLAIKSIRERGAKLDYDIHVAACSVMAHVAVHRNSTMIGNLNNAMPKSSRRKALVDWFEHYMPVKVSYDTGKVEMPKADDPKWVAFVADFDDVIENAMLKPFWDYKPEKGEKDKPSLKAVLKYITRKAASADCPAPEAALILALAKYGEGLLEGAQGELPLSGAPVAEPARPTIN